MNQPDDASRSSSVVEARRTRMPAVPRARTPTIALHARHHRRRGRLRVTMEHEATTREDLSIAQAVHNAGGTVVCQVKRLAPSGVRIHPADGQDSGLPRRLPRARARTRMQTYAYALTIASRSRARCRCRCPAVRARPPDRAARRSRGELRLELRRGDVVNLGVGVSGDDPECRCRGGLRGPDHAHRRVRRRSAVIPGHGREFGTARQSAGHHRPAATSSTSTMAAGLTCAFLSFAEVDSRGQRQRHALRQTGTTARVASSTSRRIRAASDIQRHVHRAAGWTCRGRRRPARDPQGGRVPASWSGACRAGQLQR